MTQAAALTLFWSQREPPSRLRGGLASTGAKSLLALVLIVLVTGCGGASGQRQPTPQTQGESTTTDIPTAVATPYNVFPAFSDWRAAYVDANGRLHAVTLDGTQDIAGPTLPGLDSYALGFASAGISPSGHALAYDANANLNILDVTGRTSFQGSSPLVVYQMFWSPDGSELALCDGEGSVSLVDPNKAGQEAVRGTPGRGLGQLLGWIDATHVAMTMSPTGTAITLGSLDVHSGVLRRVASISSPGLGTYSFSLSPDGSKALFYNAQFRNDQYDPTVDLIDTASGAITPLPRLAQAMGPYSGFTSVAWSPGTSLIAASSGFRENGDLQGWLLDLRADTASPLPPEIYAMGWAPSSSTLVVSTYNQFAVGQGPFELDAVTVDASGHYTSTTLTRKAFSFPFVGFVRTA